MIILIPLPRRSRLGCLVWRSVIGNFQKKKIFDWRSCCNRYALGSSDLTTPDWIIVRPCSSHADPAAASFVMATAAGDGHHAGAKPAEIGRRIINLVGYYLQYKIIIQLVTVIFHWVFENCLGQLILTEGLDLPLSLCKLHVNGFINDSAVLMMTIDAYTTGIMQACS